MADDRNFKRTTKVDYGQSGNQQQVSNDTQSQTGERRSSGTSKTDSAQQTVQSDFVNIGCRISFRVKIRGGFPNLPGDNC
jgi:hypothetical protein